MLAEASLRYDKLLEEHRRATVALAYEKSEHQATTERACASEQAHALTYAQLLTERSTIAPVSRAIRAAYLDAVRFPWRHPLDAAQMESVFQSLLKLAQDIDGSHG